MDTWIYIGAGLLVFVMVAWYLLAGSPRARSARLLAETPRSTIAAATPGQLVKLAGRVVSHGSALVSPLTGRDCVYFKCVVEQLVRSEDGRRWATVARQEQGCDFILEDPGGQLEVHLDRELLVLVEARRLNLTERTHSSVSPRLGQFLAQHGRAASDLLGLAEFRCWESAVRLGNAVVVLGQIQAPPPSGDPYRAQQGPRVVTAPPGGQLVLSDDLRRVEL